MKNQHVEFLGYLHEVTETKSQSWPTLFLG